MNSKSVFSAEEVKACLKGGLIVSCQALEHEPLYRPEGGIMPLMAKAAMLGGAVGIRANSVRDIVQIKAEVELPVIGIIKKDYPGLEPYITVTMAEVDALYEAGTDIIALDATSRPRMGGQSSADFIREIKARYPNQLLMADIATEAEAIVAAEAGADFVGTTLSGYTEETKELKGINWTLIEKLGRNPKLTLIAEGRVHTPEDARRCIDLGAFAVVVGGAITRPLEITTRFAAAIKAGK